MPRIYVVEDNDSLREAIVNYLQLEGYTVLEFDKLRRVRATLEQEPADLMILDVMLPDGDGFLEAKAIRQNWTFPIIFLTARDSESDRITGFEVGGDDYVVKPFSVRELVLRVKAILKRASTVSEEKEIFELNKHVLKIDTEAMQLFIDEKSVSLTHAEWNIILYLTKNAGIVVKRAVLLQEGLDYFAEGSERTIDTHIKNLRHKLGDQEWIETVRGFGYRFTGK